MSKFCTNCGQELDEKVKFCLNCGKEVNETSKDGSDTTVNNKRQSSNTTNSKSKVAAGLFGIFLGSLGIHNFYLGYTGKAVAQLLITILSCGTLYVVSEVWGLIEGIMILTGSISTDAEGNPLSE